MYPTASESRTHAVTAVCHRDLDAFNSKCTSLFPKDRVFMSKTQLDQAANHFLNGWNCKKVHASKSVRCFYSAPTKKAYVSKCAPSKQRKKEPSMKTQYQCPFVIRYSYLNIKKNDNKPNIMYKVKITECNPKHTCQLSKQFYQQALSTSAGHTKIKLSMMNTLLMVIKTDPSTSSKALRPLLAKYLQNDIVLNSVFIRNFRQRCMSYIARHPHCCDVTIADAALMVSTKSISAEEHSVLEDPLIQTNFNSMLQDIMAEDTTTWEALAFVRRCKKTMIGFDFRIRLDDNHRPNGLIYMTPMMCSNLLRFGDMLFLDAQKRGHNSYNWPYIGPVIKDHNLKIGLVAESIVISEDLDTYAWILRSMSQMEPRWKVSAIRVIFVDI